MATAEKLVMTEVCHVAKLLLGAVGVLDVVPVRGLHCSWECGWRNWVLGGCLFPLCQRLSELLVFLSGDHGVGALCTVFAHLSMATWLRLFTPLSAMQVCFVLVVVLLLDAWRHISKGG